MSSYEDGLDVMCSTSTISIRSKPLRTGLIRQYAIPSAPALTGPAIRQITSLVMTWDLTLFGSYYDTDEAEHRAQLSEHLELLPRAFPKLTRLRLILKSRTYYRIARPDNCLEETETALFRSSFEASGRIAELRDLAS